VVEILKLHVNGKISVHHVELIRDIIKFVNIAVESSELGLNGKIIVGIVVHIKRKIKSKKKIKGGEKNEYGEERFTNIYINNSNCYCMFD